MIKDFNGVTVTGKVCKGVKKFDKFTAFSLFVPGEKEDDGKFYRCVVFKKVKEYFDSGIHEGDIVTVQARQNVRTYKDKEYLEYLVAFIEKK